VKEYVHVQFLATAEERVIVKEKLAAFGADFVPIVMDDSYDQWPDGIYISHASYSGKISSELATLIKLQDPFLAERMQISYIPEELKNKYRKGLR
jgi:hypothetical protein